MPNLQFNRYYALPAYSTVEDGPEFPFKEGEKVNMQLVFAWSAVVTEDRKGQEDLRSINAKLEATLLPVGEETENCILSEVRRVVGESSSHLLRFPFDLEDKLQAVLTTDNEETDFPFKEGQIVIVPLIVERVKKKWPPSIDTGTTWHALISPFGNEVNGLIITQVELAQQ